MPPFRHIPRIANNLPKICEIYCNGQCLTFQDKAEQISCGDISDGHRERARILQGLQKESHAGAKQAQPSRAFRPHRVDARPVGFRVGNRHADSPPVAMPKLWGQVPERVFRLICRIYDTRATAFWGYVVRFGYLVLFACLRKGLPFGGLCRYFARFPVFRAFDTLGVTGSNPVAPNLQKPRENNGFGFPGVNPKRRKIPKMCRKVATDG